MSDSSAHYSIPKEPGRRGAMILALVVHLALLGFLWVGVSWQSSEHGGVEAEVWDTKFREAAPKAAPEPEPEPVQKIVKPEPKPEVKEAPPEVDIALAQEKKRKREEAKKKVEDDKRKKIEDDKQRRKEDADKRRQDLADSKAREKVRAEEMRRLTGQVGTGGKGTAARSTGNNRLDPSYAAKIAAKIRSNTAFAVPASLDGNPTVEYAIELLPDGSLRGRPRKLKSSGVPGFDDAVMSAIKKSEPFPADRSGKVPPSFILTHKPKG